MPLELNGTTGVQGNSGALVSGTSVASTSGTSIDFTSIPSWVKRITVMFGNVSTSGSSSYQIQLGTGSTAYTTSGYISQFVSGSTAWNTTNTATSGFVFVNGGSANTIEGNLQIINVSGNIWTVSGLVGTTFPSFSFMAGSITLGAVLTAVRITTVNGTDTFDAGTINILYE